MVGIAEFNFGACGKSSFRRVKFPSAFSTILHVSEIQPVRSITWNMIAQFSYCITAAGIPLAIGGTDPTCACRQANRLSEAIGGKPLAVRLLGFATEIEKCNKFIIAVPQATSHW